MHSSSISPGSLFCSIPPLMFEEWRGMKNDETRMKMNE